MPSASLCSATRLRSEPMQSPGCLIGIRRDALASVASVTLEFREEGVSTKQIYETAAALAFAIHRSHPHWWTLAPAAQGWWRSIADSNQAVVAQRQQQKDKIALGTSRKSPTETGPESG
jgi:hypothetical protein